jgi:hypothetical protein
MRSTLLMCCLAAAFSTTQADETTPTTTTSTTTSTSSTKTVGTSSNTEAKLSAEFADFLGSEEQANAVVSGLRQGTAFSLDSPTATPLDTTDASTTSTIDPPTDAMGYGNVRITLRLAQAELNELGITQPTNEELSAILLGGEINGTQVDGILTLRADGMGWGKIAQEYGTTVGQIMGKGASKQPTPTPYASTQTKTAGKSGYISSSTPQSGQASQPRSNGYIPSSKSTSASSVRTNGYIPSGSGKSHGAGIVTAAGGSAGGSASSESKGQSHKITTSAQGAGIVSAGGQQVSMSGVSNAGGGSKASAPGQIKKN